MLTDKLTDTAAGAIIGTESDCVKNERYMHPSLFRLEPGRKAELGLQLKKTLEETENSTELDLTSLDLFCFPPAVFARMSLVRLVLSRNCLSEVPPEIASFTALTTFDLSRNRLKVLPEEIGALHCLRDLNVMTNHLRPSERSIPFTAFKALTKLDSLDLRFNLKLLRGASRTNLTEQLASCVPATCSVLIGTSQQGCKQPSAGERNASLLRCQLEPWSTPALRRRLANEFGKETDPEDTGREALLDILLDEYAAIGPRQVRRVSGIVPPESCEPLLAELLNVMRRTHFPDGMQRERQTIKATGYIILQRSEGEIMSKSARLAQQKLKKHEQVWKLAYQLLREVDPDFAQQYTAIAMTKQFVGSPHVDTENVAPFYGLSLGEFEGGRICVESTPHEVIEVNTRYRFGKIDGRFPHWVSPFTGERYSIVYYQTFGQGVPKTTAVFPGTFTEDGPDLQTLSSN